MPLLPRRKPFPPYPYSPKTAVVDRSTTTLASLKTRLGVEGTDDDALLTSLLQGAKEDADRYLNNAFLQRGEDFAPLDPAVELPIPSTVEEGLIQLVRLRFATAEGGARAANLKREKITDLEQEYFEGGAVVVEDEIKARCWRRYRITPIG